MWQSYTHFAIIHMCQSHTCRNHTHVAVIHVSSTSTGSEEDGWSIDINFVKEMIETFKQQKTIHKRFALHIVLQVGLSTIMPLVDRACIYCSSSCMHAAMRGTQAQQLLKQLPSLVRVPVPQDGRFTVCGDIHGQFYDLLNVFEMNGLPSDDNPYLFNGAPVLPLLTLLTHTAGTHCWHTLLTHLHTHHQVILSTGAPSQWRSSWSCLRSSASTPTTFTWPEGACDIIWCCG